MAAFGIPRDRSTVVQYLLLVAIMVGGGGTSLALLLDTYRSKVERIYYNGKTFSPYKLVTLNPLLDVKNFLLSRYPLPRPEEERVAPTYRAKKAIYDAFLADDLGAVIAVADQLSYEAKPDSVSYRFYAGKGYAAYSDLDIHQIIDALDTTVLLTAYLFDRMNLRSAARKYYAAYHQAMRAIVLPGLDTRFRVPSRRMVAARVKLRLLLDSPVSKAHADASYVDTLIEMFLQETLADKAFSRYRREGIVYPVAAKKIFHHRFSTTTFDPGPLVQAIKAASGPERNVLVYEYCLSRNFAGSDIGDVCSAASIEALFGQRSFATASLKFAFLLDFMNRHPNPHDPHHMWPKGPIEAVLVKNDENAALIEEAKQTFQSLRESAESSLEAESSFLNDDILFLAYRFYNHVGEQEKATQSLCQIVQMPVEDADHALLAKAVVRSKSHACPG